MAKIITFFLALNGLLISLFVGYHLLFVILYPIIRWKKAKQSVASSVEKYNKFAIIIPAHNEELFIGDVLQSSKMLNYPLELYEIIVIADNCTDKTAQITREMSIKCLDRQDSRKRGKPYAIDWAFKQIDLNNYDAVVIIDADTLLDRNFLYAMNRKLNEGAEVIQGYFGIMNPDDTWVTRLAVIPGILKFNLRYFCKDFSRLSCPLMGNGMCFSKIIISTYGWNAFSITENWEYFAKLVLNNHIPAYSGDALIYSHAVTALKHGEIQRKRWLQGSLQTAIEYVPKLLVNGLRERKIAKLDAALELVLPSYAMLFNWTIISLVALSALWALDLQTFSLLVWFLSLALAQLGLFALGLIMGKVPFKTWMSLIYIPIFLIWKFIVSVKGMFGFQEREWIKTERKKSL